jgi:chemotaxis protein MotA
MDLATALGIIVGSVLVVVVLILDGGAPAELFSVPQAILLIIGGSLAASTITVPLEVFTKLPKFISIAMMGTHFDTAGTIEMLTKMTDRARREGLLALEEDSKNIKDAFMRKAIMLLVDGVDASQVRTIMETTIEQMADRHSKGFGFFTSAGGFAPTFGIIGTVMGLMNALKMLDNPEMLAEAIAGAFLATLWGLLLSNLVYLPLGKKLKFKSEEEVNYRVMIMEGVLALQAGENPRVLREKLSAYLPPEGAKKAKPEKAEKNEVPAGQTAKA